MCDKILFMESICTRIVTLFPILGIIVSVMYFSFRLIYYFYSKSLLLEHLNCNAYNLCNSIKIFKRSITTTQHVILNYEDELKNMISFKDDQKTILYFLSLLFFNKDLESVNNLIDDYRLAIRTYKDILNTQEDIIFFIKNKKLKEVYKIHKKLLLCKHVEHIALLDYDLKSLQGQKQTTTRQDIFNKINDKINYYDKINGDD